MGTLQTKIRYVCKLSVEAHEKCCKTSESSFVDRVVLHRPPEYDDDERLMEKRKEARSATNRTKPTNHGSKSRAKIEQEPVTKAISKGRRCSTFAIDFDLWNEHTLLIITVIGGPSPT